MEAWLNEIGERLGKTTLANAYPYCFKLLNEDSINAFALQRRTDARSRRLIKAAEDKGECPVHSARQMRRRPEAAATHRRISRLPAGLHDRMFSRRMFPVDGVSESTT